MFNMSLLLVVSAVIIACFAVLLVFYLRAEAKNDGNNGFKRATGLKLTLSGIFCAAGIFSYYLLFSIVNVNVPPQIFILLGLLAGLAGDFFLQYIRLNVKKYIAGILCFAAAQALFITYLLIAGMPDILGWILTVAITAAVLLCVLALMKKQNWQLGAEQKVLTLYTVLLTFMTVRAVLYMAGRFSFSSVLFALGALLFWSSDMLLGYWNYHSNKKVHANLNWITYYAGMLLIAFSIMPN